MNILFTRYVLFSLPWSLGVHLMFLLIIVGWQHLNLKEIILPDNDNNNNNNNNKKNNNNKNNNFILRG